MGVKSFHLEIMVEGENLQLHISLIFSFSLLLVLKSDSMERGKNPNGLNEEDDYLTVERLPLMTQLKNTACTGKITVHDIPFCLKNK